MALALCKPPIRTRCASITAWVLKSTVSLAFTSAIKAAYGIFSLFWGAQQTSEVSKTSEVSLTPTFWDDAAYARYAELNASRSLFYFDRMTFAPFSSTGFSGNMEQAIKALGLNIGSYPEYIESYLEQTRLYLKMGEKINPEETLSKALSIELCNTVAEHCCKKSASRTHPNFFHRLVPSLPI